MANFGTYEGHKILSNAMDTTINNVQRAFEHKEQKKNNFIARQKAQANFAAQNKELAANNAREGILQQIFRDTSDSPIIQRDAAGNTVVSENYKDILDTWTRKHSYSDYINQTGEDTSGKEWSGKDLTYGDMQYINEASTDYAKTKLLGLKKSLSHLNEDQFNEFFKKNEGFSNEVKGYLMELGQSKPEDSEWYSTFNTDSGTGVLANEIKASTYFTPDGDDADYSGYQKIHGDTSDWGGGTYFKSHTLSPTNKDIGDKKILLQAIENMRNGEIGKNTQLDDMWLEAQGDGKFSLGEDDSWSPNDYYEVRVHEGKAQVKVEGQWQEMSRSSGSIW